MLQFISEKFATCNCFQQTPFVKWISINYNNFKNVEKKNCIFETETQKRTGHMYIHQEKY